MELNNPVSSIMSTGIDCVSPDQKIVDLKHIYEKQQFHHHIPVTENGKLVGMVSLIDFMRAISNAGLDDNETVYQNILVKDIMSIHPFSMDVNTTIKDVATELSKGEFHSVVITENGGVSGIVTSTDLIRFLLK
jgi:CBS domain-containing protein